MDANDIAALAGWFFGGLFLKYVADLFKPWVWDKGRKLREFGKRFSLESKSAWRISRMMAAATNLADLRRIRSDAGELQRHTMWTLLFALLATTGFMLVWLSPEMFVKILGLVVWSFFANGAFAHARDVFATSAKRWDRTHDKALRLLVRRAEAAGVDRDTIVKAFEDDEIDRVRALAHVLNAHEP